MNVFDRASANRKGASRHGRTACAFLLIDRQNLALIGKITLSKPSFTEFQKPNLKEKQMRPLLKTLSNATLAVTALTLPAMAEPFYLIAQIQIEDQERYFNEYGAAAVDAVIGSGGRVLVASPTVDTLEGDWAGNWTVVIEFPSEDAALKDWYMDETYQQAIDLRLASTSLNNLVVAPGFVPPAE